MTKAELEQALNDVLVVVADLTSEIRESRTAQVSVQQAPAKKARTAKKAKKVDRRVIPMSDEKKALRQKLYDEFHGGPQYHAACLEAGIPTKQNGLLNK